MSKYAQLPDGTTLEFPDDTPDEVIDKIVKAHLQGAGSASSSPVPGDAPAPVPAPIPAPAPASAHPPSPAPEPAIAPAPNPAPAPTRAPALPPEPAAPARMAASAARPGAQKKQTPPKNNKLVFGVIGGVLVLGVAGFLLWTQVLKRDASDAARDAANGAAPIGQASAPRVVPPESAPAPIAAPDAATNDAMAAPAALPQAGTEAAEDYYGVDCDAYSGVRQSACDAWQKIHADEMRQRADAEYDDASSGDIDRERQQRELEQQRAELERQRQDLARQRKEADAQRRAAEAQREEAAAMAAQAERERAEREQRQAAEAAEQGPTANELYESRRRECPGGFLGSDCRKKIRNQVCEGHWASNPPPGYSECASSKRH